MSLCILGYEKNESDLRLLEEAKKKFESVFFVPINRIGIGLKDEFSITYRTTDMFKFEAILPRIPKKHYSFAYQLLSLFPEDRFMPVKPISYLIANERFFLLTVLRKRGIPTINMHMTGSVKSAERILETIDYPVMIRSPEKKTGILVKNYNEGKNIAEAIINLGHHVLIEDCIKNLVSVYFAEPNIITCVKKKTKESDIIFSKGELKTCKIDIETEQ
ncbi:MAG: hypothetical protein DRP15_02035, partial [Candidatus Aenigmatarchaeota archaeon]